MPKYLLFMLLFLFTITQFSCNKDQRIILLSNHKWTVSNSSPGGIAGEEYHFMDNRLFFRKTITGEVIEGRWNFFSNDLNIVKVVTESSSISYQIKKINATELIIYTKELVFGTYIISPNLIFTPS